MDGGSSRFGAETETQGRNLYVSAFRFRRRHNIYLCNLSNNLVHVNVTAVYHYHNTALTTTTTFVKTL